MRLIKKRSDRELNGVHFNRSSFFARLYLHKTLLNQACEIFTSLIRNDNGFSVSEGKYYALSKLITLTLFLLA